MNLPGFLSPQGVATAAFFLVVAMTVVSLRESGRVRLICLSVLATLLVTALVGGLSVLYKLPRYVAVVDEALALALLTALTVLTTWLYTREPEQARSTTV